MSGPYFGDDQATLWHGDSLEVVSALPTESVDCCVTSPPYFGLRDYGTEGQYGLEASPAEYVETMRRLFAEVRRVLADDGTLWLNLGDSYSTRVVSKQSSHQRGLGFESDDLSKTWVEQRAAGRTRMPSDYGLPEKNLVGIPWRVAFALQDDGWILRNDIIWAKANGMPESVSDRLTSKHEHVFLFSKSRRYWFDLNPIREATAYQPGAPNLSWARDTKESVLPGRSGESAVQHRSSRTHGKASGTNLAPSGQRHDQANNPLGRNPGDVWTIPTQPFGEAHFAVMPPALAERCVMAGCKPGGTVLDPFSGSRTTGLAAARHGRKYVGVDLSAEYLDLSLRTRLAQPGINFEAS